jgi:hypothetical protein
MWEIPGWSPLPFINALHQIVNLLPVSQTSLDVKRLGPDVFFQYFSHFTRSRFTFKTLIWFYILEEPSCQWSRHCLCVLILPQFFVLITQLYKYILVGFFPGFCLIFVSCIYHRGSKLEMF